MLCAKLTRDHIFPDCVFGTLIVGGKVFYTLERPWMDNTPNISCIPTGFYHCRYKSASNNGNLKNVFEVQNVPDRAGILIHVGNQVSDSSGCILLALGRDIEQRRIVNSRKGMEQLIEICGDEFELCIQELKSAN